VNLFLNATHMHNIFRATVLVGLLALATTFIQPSHAAGPTTKIVLDPASATITADQSQTFKVMAVDADGATTDVTDQATLTAPVSTDPLGKVAGMVYTPSKTGVHSAQASFQSFTTTAAVTVTAGTAKEVVVNPNSEPEQAYIGTNVIFSATVYDAKNNILSDQKIVWTVIGENGSVNAQGVFVPKKVGTGKVQAAVGDVTGQVSVVVNPTIVTNTNTVTNTTKNTNTVKNTNTTTSNANTNTVVVNTTDTTTTKCTTLKPWAWIGLLIIFLLAVAILFALVPITAIWPVVAALVAAAILAFIQRKYDCNGQAWWSWVIMLGTIALAGAALMMRPKNTPTA